MLVVLRQAFERLSKRADASMAEAIASVLGKLMTKFCSVAAMALLVFAALGPDEMAAPHGARFSDRARPGLFCGHVDGLPRLAPAVRGRGEPSWPPRRCWRPCKV